MTPLVRSPIIEKKIPPKGLSSMSIFIRKAAAADLDAIARLYDDLNDYHAARINYPGWKKGVYPTRTDAEEGLSCGSLYVAECDGQIGGTVIYLDSQPEAYRSVQWQIETDAPVVVLHILAVHPAFTGRGVGRALVGYADTVAKERGARAVRLDTHENNLPAIRLYEKCGLRPMGMVDLGLEEIYGLKWYRVFEKVI